MIDNETREITFAEYCEAKQLLKDSEEMLNLSDSYEEGELAFQCVSVAKKIIKEYERAHPND